ncbi:MAG: methionine--tRNA ligase [Saprospiraceae bacterium]
MSDFFFQPKRYLITSALPYANGPLHIGHLAGAYLASDAYTRYLRLMGKEVVHVCGSDEHGAAITIRARKENTTPQEIVDRYHTLIKQTFEKLGVSFDIYHRTSDPVHHTTSQDFFRTLYQKGEFVEKETNQYFDEEAGQFLADRYIIGTCPNCGNEEAYGDQCEKCGSTLSPEELINPRSTLTGSTPVLKPTKHWFLPLDKYAGWLKEWINTGELDGTQLHDPAEWKNHVIGQCNSWLDAGLHPRSMTRDLDWGVDVPPEIPGAAGKKLYVWMDAPIGYVSATKAWAAEQGKDWQIYWQDPDTQLVHFIGKDNIVFHCLIFPAILHAHGSFVLPKNVPANQFMNLEGRKLSTSKGWAVWVHEYLEDFPGRQDVLRYTIVKNMPEQRDSEFTWKSYQDANNNELVGNLANFVNRVLVLTQKFYQGEVPEFDPDEGFTGAFDPEWPSYHDSELLLMFDHIQEISRALREFEFREALKRIMELSSMGNQILQYNEPWKTVNDDPELVKVVMNICLQIVAALSVVVRPFLPFTSDKMRQLLNMEPIREEGELVKMLDDLSEGLPLLTAGHFVEKPEHLFTRIDDETIQAQMDKLNQPLEEEEAEKSGLEPVKGTVDYDQFSKMDIRTGTIVQAMNVPKADKLLQLTVDLGFEQRTIVSGIAQHYAPEEIIGKEVLVLVNLAPRKLRGVISNGMILTAEDPEGNLIFVRPEKTVTPGSTVK